MARIINSLSHIPIDTMRAIAVLDAPAEIENEASNVTANGEAGVIPYGAETEGGNENATEGQPEEPGPENGTVTEETLPQPQPKEPPSPTPPTENMSGAQEALEEMPRYNSIEDVKKEGDKYFLNATTGLMGLSNELEVLKYGTGLTIELLQMSGDMLTTMEYTYLLNAYKGSTNGSNFDDDLKSYSAARIELDKKYQRYTIDRFLNETESQDLWNDIGRLQDMNGNIQNGVKGGERNINAYMWGMGQLEQPPEPTTLFHMLFGRTTGYDSSDPNEGIVDNVSHWMDEDFNILSQARTEVETRQRELGVRQ
jgi:hypothetical protein